MGYVQTELEPRVVRRVVLLQVYGLSPIINKNTDDGKWSNAPGEGSKREVDMRSRQSLNFNSISTRSTTVTVIFNVFQVNSVPDLES